MDKCSDCRKAPRSGRSKRCDACIKAHRRAYKTQHQRELRGMQYTSRDAARADLLPQVAARAASVRRLLDQQMNVAMHQSHRRAEAMRDDLTYRAMRALVDDVDRLLPLVSKSGPRS